MLNVSGKFVIIYRLIMIKGCGHRWEDTPKVDLLAWGHWSSSRHWQWQRAPLTYPQGCQLADTCCQSLCNVCHAWLLLEACFPLTAFVVVISWFGQVVNIATWESDVELLPWLSYTTISFPEGKSMNDNESLHKAGDVTTRSFFIRHTRQHPRKVYPKRPERSACVKFGLAVWIPLAKTKRPARLSAWYV